MDEILKRIRNNQKKNNNNVKKDWYKVGKALLNGEKITWNKESKVATRRVYRYYTLGKGDWNGPTPRMFAKMGREKFEENLQVRRKQQEEEILKEISELISNFQGEDLSGVEPCGMTDHVINHGDGQDASDVTLRQIGETSPVMTNQEIVDHWLNDM